MASDEITALVEAERQHPRACIAWGIEAGQLTEMPILAKKIVMSKSKPTMTEALRAAIKRSGKTRYQIAQDTGILQTSLSRFVRGETSLRLDKADVLAEYLGLELKPKRKK